MPKLVTWDLMGIPDVRIKSHESLLPAWAQRDDLGLDVEAEAPQSSHMEPGRDDDSNVADIDGPAISASEDSVGLGPEPDAAPVPFDEIRLDVFADTDAVDIGDGAIFFMPTVATVAGLQHIVNNLSADTHKSLKYWDTFFSS